MTRSSSMPGAPTPPNPFVGRDAELDALAVALEQHRVVALVGPEGAGKTRLACEAAFRVDRREFFADLTSARSREDVLVAMARALGPDGLHPSSIGRIGRVLANRRAVLVLDGGDRAAAAVDATLQILGPQLGEARVLVTRRGRIDDAATVEVGPLRAEDAVELYLQRGAGPRPIVRDLVLRLGHLPLAIELASASPSAVPAALSRHLAERGVGADGSGAEVLAQVVQWAWDALDPWCRAALAQLAVFETPFTAAAAGTMLGVGAVEGVWEPLLATATLVALEGSDPARARLHDSVRALARRHTPARAVERGTRLVLDRARQCVARRSRPGGFPFRASLIRLLPELLAVVDRGSDAAPEAAWLAGVGALWAGSNRLALDLVERSLAAGPRDDAALQLLRVRGVVRARRDEPEDALEDLSGVAQQAEAAGRLDMAASTWNQVAGLLRTRADREGALQASGMACQLAEGAGDPFLLARCRLRRAVLLVEGRDRVDQALEELEAVADVAQLQRAPWMEGQALAFLGTWRTALQGDVPLADLALQRSIACFERVNDELQVADARLRRVVAVLLPRRALDEAESEVRAARAVQRRWGSEDAGWLERRLGVIDLLRGAWDAASAHFSAALDLDRSGNRPLSALLDRRELGISAVMAGQSAAALEILGPVAVEARRIGATDCEVGSLVWTVLAGGARPELFERIEAAGTLYAPAVPLTRVARAWVAARAGGDPAATLEVLLELGDHPEWIVAVACDLLRSIRAQERTRTGQDHGSS